MSNIGFSYLKVAKSKNFLLKFYILNCYCYHYSKLENKTTSLTCLKERRAHLEFRKASLLTSSMFQLIQGKDQLFLRNGENIGLFITLVPKVLKLCFPIRWLNNFGDVY